MRTMLPVAQITHVAPGRLRLRIPAMRGDAGFFTSLVRSIEQEAIGNVHANVMTGSILVEGLVMSVDQVCTLARERGWVDIASHQVLEPLQALSFENWQRERSQDLLRIAPLVMVALSTIQLGRGNVLPPALSMLLYALDFARAANVSARR